MLDYYDIFIYMERIFKDKQISFIKDDLWNNTFANRSSIITPLYLERYRGVRLSKEFSYHEHWEFSVNVSGSGILLADRKLQIIPDMIFLIPPGLKHWEFSEHELDTIWLGFQAELIGVAQDKVLAIKSPDMVKKIIDYWSFSVRNHGPIGPELDGQLMALTGYFFRKLSSSLDQTPMQQAVEYFNEHFQKAIAMSELAEQLNFSEGHFYRQFKNFTGETPIRFLNSIRLKKASFYLQHSELPINKISFLCGFSDPYYFSRVFSKKYKLNPSLYRKRYYKSAQ